MRSLLLPLLLIVSLLLINGCSSPKKGSPQKSHPPITAMVTQQRSIGKWMEAKNHLNIEERIAGYHQLKKDSLLAYNFNQERSLNQYGYSLLYSGKPQEAIAIFKLLVAEFPDMANPYDSLAEAYQKTGDKENAIINYEKSFALDPANTHAAFEVKVLKGMLDILDTDWGKEIFEIPLRFAPNMKLEGFEDARFTKGWGDKTSDELWSYVFAWKIKEAQPVTANLLEKNLNLYFQGLLSLQEDDSPVTALVPVNEAAGLTFYEGTIEFLDTRLTKEMLTLNIKAESRFCREEQAAVIVFWFSPKAYDHPTWEKLNTVQALVNICAS